MDKNQLTPHFKLAEFSRSATAEANRIDNDRRVIANQKNICIQVLEPLRDFARAPVIVSSWIVANGWWVS